MAGALVGGAFLSASLQVLFDRMASPEVLEFVRGKTLTDKLLKKSKITLLSANIVLNDAEDKQLTNKFVKEWVDELKDAVYNAEDLLDLIRTEACRRKLEAECQIGTSRVQSSMSTPLLAFDLNSKLKDILETLDNIVKQINVLGLREVSGVKSFKRLPTTCLVDETGVYGRHDDKEAIINWLLSDDASVDEIGVIPIVGMGGVGKTTLAQLVYNDDRVNDHFDLNAWVCVSEDFDICRITKTVLDSVTLSSSQGISFILIRALKALLRFDEIRQPRSHRFELVRRWRY